MDKIKFIKETKELINHLKNGGRANSNDITIAYQTIVGRNIKICTSCGSELRKIVQQIESHLPIYEANCSECKKKEDIKEVKENKKVIITHTKEDIEKIMNNNILVNDLQEYFPEEVNILLTNPIINSKKTSKKNV